MVTEDLIWEVLVRLPTKYLMRFKCMSKLWYSIIGNPKFANAHNGGGGGCFRGPLIRDYSFHDPVVNGLMGLYNYDINDFALCNIATHEFVKLPPTPSPTVSPDTSDDIYYYFLGFNPVNELYKAHRYRSRRKGFRVILRDACSSLRNLVSSEAESPVNQQSSGNLPHHNHVFTLEVNNLDLNWRDTTAAPLDIYYLSQQCRCINGALYWLPQEGKYQQTLTVFHLNTDTFETIVIPECTKGMADLVDICRRPALLTYLDNYSVEQWDVRTMNNHCRGGEKEEWTRKRVLFVPFQSDFW
ncbi:hypothetical protein LIER_32370 [Lithospermum erythrorhizon]|uniref:F-box domain-containing protein n=1 Tax=Lithospermum erythrorhizon TaxID=34254 RepID=A0AAV3RXJ0_LITER